MEDDYHIGAEQKSDFFKDLDKQFSFLPTAQWVNDTVGYNRVNHKQKEIVVADVVPANWTFEKTKDYIASLASFFTGLTKAFVAFIILAAILLCLAYIISGLFDKSVYIREFSVPKDSDKTGITSLVAAQQFGDAMLQIKEQASSHNDTIGFRLASDQIDIEIPETNLTLNKISQLIRHTFGFYETTVSGELHCSTIDCKGSSSYLDIRVTSDGSKIFADQFPIENGKINKTYSEAAKRIVEKLDPYLAAVFHFRKDQYTRADQLARPLLASDDTDIHKWAFSLLGRMCEDSKQCDAEEYFNNALNLDPDFTIALDNRASYLTTVCDNKIGAEMKKRGVSKDKVDVAQICSYELLEIHKNLTHAYKFRSYMSDAQLALYYKHRGDIAQTQDRYVLAEKEYKQALTYRPSYQAVRKKLGDIRSRERDGLPLDYKIAHEHYRLGLVAEPDGWHTYRIYKNWLRLLKRELGIDSSEYKKLNGQLLAKLRVVKVGASLKEKLPDDFENIEKIICQHLSDNKSEFNVTCLVKN